MRIGAWSRWLPVATLLSAAHPPHAARSSFAAPGVIVFSGGPVKSPIVLSDWAENQRLMLAAIPAAIPDSDLARRPKIDIAMYWGGEWSHYAASVDSLALLRRIRVPQPGAYYPASGGRPAVWIFGPMGAMPASRRHLASEGIAILRAHHLPVAIR
jgi:hypothetical protein